MLPNWYKRKRFGRIKFSRKVTSKKFAPLAWDLQPRKKAIVAYMKQSEMDLVQKFIGGQQHGEVPRSELDFDPCRTAASSAPPELVGGTSHATSVRPSTRNRAKEVSKTACTKFILSSRFEQCEHLNSDWVHKQRKTEQIMRKDNRHVRCSSDPSTSELTCLMKTHLGKTRKNQIEI